MRFHVPGRMTGKKKRKGEEEEREEREGGKRRRREGRKEVGCEVKIIY